VHVRTVLQWLTATQQEHAQEPAESKVCCQLQNIMSTSRSLLAVRSACESLRRYAVQYAIGLQLLLHGLLEKARDSRLLRSHWHPQVMYYHAQTCVACRRDAASQWGLTDFTYKQNEVRRRVEVVANTRILHAASAIMISSVTLTSSVHAWLVRSPQSEVLNASCAHTRGTPTT
jgi:hypothetical protein